MTKMTIITRSVALLSLCYVLTINVEVIAEGDKQDIIVSCGNRNRRGAGNQVSGARDGQSQFGEFPWMLSIFKQNSAENKTYICGASLIHPQVALTAAHCVDDNITDTKLIVRAGAWDMDLIVEILPFQDREVKEVIIHPKYVASVLHNDVALLILKSPLELAEHISTVCLPPQNHIVESGKGFAMGWGKEKFNETVEDAIIEKKIELPLVTNDICEENLKNTSLGPSFQLHESFMCAGGEPGKDTCKGDGGSPLVFPLKEDPARWYQAGIVAWGIECWESRPGVYANVAKFRDWIDEQVKNHSFDTSTYQYQPQKH